MAANWSRCWQSAIFMLLATDALLGSKSNGKQQTKTKPNQTLPSMTKAMTHPAKRTPTPITPLQLHLSLPPLSLHPHSHYPTPANPPEWSNRTTPHSSPPTALLLTCAMMSNSRAAIFLKTQVVTGKLLDLAHQSTQTQRQQHNFWAMPRARLGGASNLVM